MLSIPEWSFRTDAPANRYAALVWPKAYGWGPAEVWADGVGRGMAQHVPVERADITQPDESVVHFGWRDPGGGALLSTSGASKNSVKGVIERKRSMIAG